MPQPSCVMSRRASSSSTFDCSLRFTYTVCRKSENLHKRLCHHSCAHAAWQQARPIRHAVVVGSSKVKQ
jgi:hypothetical protein